MWSALTDLPFIVAGVIWVWIGGLWAIASGLRWLARPGRRTAIVRAYPLQAVTWLIAGPALPALLLVLLLMTLGESWDPLIGLMLLACVTVIVMAHVAGRMWGQVPAWTMLVIAVGTTVAFEYARIAHPPSTVLGDTLAEAPILVGCLVNAVFAVGKARLPASSEGEGSVDKSREGSAPLV